jgi:hypothetical protein
MCSSTGLEIGSTRNVLILYLFDICLILSFIGIRKKRFYMMFTIKQYWSKKHGI